MQQLVCVAAPLALLLLLVAGTQVVVVEGAGVNKEVWGSMSSKLSGIIIPGFVSSQLRAWAILDCPYTPLDFRPLDPVWLDTKKVGFVCIFSPRAFVPSFLCRNTIADLDSTPRAERFE